MELNNTFYARPTAQRIAAWGAATPPAFRFIVKGQRGASWRAMRGGAADSVPWLTETLVGFGERLGAVLFRVPGEMPRDDDALDALLAAWPRALPLVVEPQHASWHVDETIARLRDASAVLCATDLDGTDEPPLRRTGAFLYLRLRRSSYDEDALDRWARRLVPFLDDGMDAFVVLRHDPDGRNALLAESFPGRVERARRSGP